MDHPELLFELRSLRWLCACILGVLLVSLGIDIFWVWADVRKHDAGDQWRKEAREYTDALDWDGLLEHAEQWLAEEPGNPYALERKATALYQLGDYAAAAEVFRDTIRAVPQWQDKIQPCIEMCDKLAREEAEAAEERAPPATP